jgi:hypothetical protein
VRQITYRHIREINLNPSAGTHSDLGSESYDIQCGDVTPAQMRNADMRLITYPDLVIVRFGTFNSEMCSGSAQFCPGNYLEMTGLIRSDSISRVKVVISAALKQQARRGADDQGDDHVSAS